MSLLGRENEQTLGNIPFLSLIDAMTPILKCQYDAQFKVVFDAIRKLIEPKDFLKGLVMLMLLQ